MNIIVISDIHDRIDHLSLVLEQLQNTVIDRIFCLGDVGETSSLKALVDMTPTIPIDMVYGNNDFDIMGFEKISLKHPRLVLYGETASISIAGKRMSLTHSPFIARDMAESGQYDFVFYGHTHEAATRMIGQCLLANPGEIEGRTGKIGYGLFNTDAFEFIIHSVRV